MVSNATWILIYRKILSLNAMQNSVIGITFDRDSLKERPNVPAKRPTLSTIKTGIRIKPGKSSIH